jgi:hypothetical protein
MNKFKLIKHFKLNDKEKLLLFPEGIINLNETAYDIIIECNNKTLDEIKKNLEKKYTKISGVEDFIEEAKNNNWIEEIKN